MNKKMKRIVTLIMAMTLFITTSIGSTSLTGAQQLPQSLEAPEIILYDKGEYNTELMVKAKNTESFMDFYEKAFVNVKTEGGVTTSDYGEWFGSYVSGIQIDYKIDDGSWQYDSSWDNNLSSSYIYGYVDETYTEEIVAGYTTSYDYYYKIGEVLKSLGYLTETSDGSTNYYRFKYDDHTIFVRARYFVVLNNNENDSKIIMSDWSQTASYGQGSETASSAPATLNAPVISKLEIYGEGNYNGAPETRFKIEPDSSVTDAMLWAEQYNGALEDSDIWLVVETSLDPNFAAGSTIVKDTYYESSSLMRQIYYDDMFYNMWYDLPQSDRDAFVWNGETIYLRAKYVNDRTVSGSDSSIESPYSNVISLTGPTITKYDINITHNPYGFDDESYGYSESYSITQGRTLDSVYCAPLEGCYVDTVEVNGVIMYDKDDEATHELLDWYSSYTAFDFLSGEDIATKNLNIEITYGGTPTAKYGITTECGNGGNIYTDANFDTWNDNSLVVYHGTEPKITIVPNMGYEIEKVEIDGVVNAQAKADGYYTFPAITDNSHSISVTFKRVSYEVASYVYHGTINTDYEGYSYSNDYVKIGDDITFTFSPNKDASDNYYEIERVEIDGVVNEEAKNAGTYTFENVQTNHTIYVYYSEDAVITHDITATSGAHGSISPEGVIHAKEGSTKRFEFIPDNGYEVDKVFVDGQEIVNLASKEYYNIANITEEHTIEVTFKKLPVQYDVNVIVSGHNPTVHTVNPKGVTPVWEGGSFNVSYSPFAGYEVEKVLVNGASVSTNGSYSIANVNEDYTIEIFFKIINYTVTFVDHDGRVLKTETVPHGEEATAPAAPSRDHYKFAGWDTDFGEVTANVTIRATYVPEEYNVKFVGWNGTVLKTETVEYGADATAPVPPEREGYEFDRWSHDYTNVSCDLTVTAVYKQKEYTVEFFDWDGGLISTQTVKHGESAIVPKNPQREGYTFVGWDDLNYGRVEKDLSITAMYAKGDVTTYTITANAFGDSGTITPYGVTTVEEGSSLTLHFTPSELSKIAKVEIDGEEVEICTSYSFENINVNHTVAVYFTPTAVINFNDDELENGTAYGDFVLIEGTLVYGIDVTPDEGYELEGIYINGQKTDLELIDGKYIIRDLSDDMDIEIAFKLIVTDGDDTDGDDTDGDDADGDLGEDDNENDSDDTNAGSDDVPATGDNSYIIRCIIMLIMSVAGMVITCLVYRKRRA